MKKHCEARQWHERRRKIIDMIQVYDEALSLNEVYEEVRKLLVNLHQDINDLSQNNLEAMMVNYIRHENTSYDEILNTMDKVYRQAPAYEKNMTYHMMRNAVLSKIAKVYPSLQDQCNKQKWPIVLYRVVED